MSNTPLQEIKQNVVFSDISLTAILAGDHPSEKSPVIVSTTASNIWWPRLLQWCYHSLETT